LKTRVYEEIVVSQHQYCVTTILAGLTLGILKNFLPLKVKIFLFFYIDDNKIKERRNNIPENKNGGFPPT